MTTRKEFGTGKVWVQSDPSTDGTSYIATIHYTEDVSYSLADDEAALTYAAALMRAVAESEYDAAIHAQMTMLAKGYPKERLPEGPGPQPSFIVNEFRELRGGVSTVTAGPLSMTPGVSALNGKPFLVCQVDGLKWQWSPADVKEHVSYVLEVGMAARLDGLYLQLLTDENRLGLDQRVAQATVEALGNHRS